MRRIAVLHVAARRAPLKVAVEFDSAWRVEAIPRRAQGEPKASRSHNQLTAQELPSYIDFVNRASELLVEAHADEARWASHAVVEAAGSSLRQAALMGR